VRPSIFFAPLAALTSWWKAAEITSSILHQEGSCLSVSP
jgi:hypothetical protein